MQLLYALVAAGAYYVAGRLGLLLAIPPGFASAVWPAAGIGLACAQLLSRTSACIGAAVGSFFVNFGVVSQGFTAFAWGMLPLPVTIAMGAATQVWFGFWLYQRLIGARLCIDSPQHIGSFLAVVSPVGCLIGATIGASGLLISGLIDSGQLGFTWFTWWMGDTIGVMLFAPLLLTLAAKDVRLTPARRLSIAAPIAIIFTSVMLLFLWSSSSRQQQDAQYISIESTEIFERAEKRLQTASDLLKAFDAAFSNSDEVTQTEFNLVATIVLSDTDWFHAVGWVPVLAGADRTTFETAMRQNGNANFALTEIGTDGELQPAQPQTTYYPVQYIYPFQGNERAIGLNLGANNSRLQALENARALRRPVATAPIQLVQSKQLMPAMILYKPIFKREARTSLSNTPLFSRTELQGYISGVFTFAQLFGDLMHEAEARKLSLHIEDTTDPKNLHNLISNAKSPLRNTHPLQFHSPFGERTFRFTFYPSEAFATSAKDWSSWNILTFGFLLAALLQGFILLITGHTKSVEEEVERKTEQLQLAKSQAENANAAKTRFLASMSHELRTPLHAVTGLLAMCLKTNLTGEQKHYLTKAKVAASALVALINQTIDYSKIEAGKLTLKREPFSIKDVLERIETIFSVEAETKGIHFSFKLPKEVPERFIGDALRIEQVLSNLCANAIKFTEHGSVELTMRIETHQKNSRNVCLQFTVTDTGIGIDQEDLGTLFDAFQQADASNTRKYGGTGLGLSICQKLAEAMQGSITIASLPQRGTTATFQVNLDVENPEARVHLQSPNDGPMIAVNSTPEIHAELLKNRKVLVVEDIQINQEIARFMLEDYGADVSIASNGREALEKLNENPHVDLILMDIQMPEMDGLEATQRIRESENLFHIPVIAMTANAIKGDIHDCLEAGMDAHVAKPIDEHELMRKIHACLNKACASKA